MQKIKTVPQKCKCGGVKFWIKRRKYRFGLGSFGTPVCCKCGKPLFTKYYQGILF